MSRPLKVVVASNYQITSEPLKARIRLAAERAAPLFGVHPHHLLKIA